MNHKKLLKIQLVAIFICSLLSIGVYADSCKNCAYLDFSINTNGLKSSVEAKLIDTNGTVKTVTIPSNSQDFQVYTFGLIPVSSQSIKYSRSMDLIDPNQKISICTVTGSAVVVQTGKHIALVGTRIAGVYNNPAAAYQCSAKINNVASDKAGVDIFLTPK